MSASKVDVATLKKVPIFSSMADAELQAIISAPENGLEQYESKALIIREMEIAECMYVILEGSVEVSLRGEDNFGREVVIATLRTGDFFGEQALAENTTTGRRGASVRCQLPTKLFRIDKKHVKLGLKRDRLGAEDQTVTRMSAKDKEVRDLVGKMRLFQSLTEPELSNIGSWTEVVPVGPGDFVIKESEKGDCMYVVLEGAVEIFTLDDDGKISSILATHKKGSYFGEQALMPGSSGIRTAYARANGIARLVKVPKEYFRLILNRDSEVAQTLLKTGLAQKKQRDTFHKGK